MAAGLSGYKAIAEEAYEVSKIAGYLDFANVMAYDYHGYWDGKTGHHSPLTGVPGDKYPSYNAEDILNYYVSKGFAKSQLNLGIPFYGQSYTLASKTAHGLEATSSGPGAPGRYSGQHGMLTYYEICQAGFKTTASADHGSYGYDGDQWVSFNDIADVENKAEFVEDNSFAGVAVWTMDMDDFQNLCCKGANPLLNMINHVLRGVELPGNNGCARPPPPVTPKPGEFTTASNDGSGT